MKPLEFTEKLSRASVLYFFILFELTVHVNFKIIIDIKRVRFCLRRLGVIAKICNSSLEITFSFCQLCLQNDNIFFGVLTRSIS